MIQKYRKKPVVIEAIQWEGTYDNYQQIINWSENTIKDITMSNGLIIPTLEGNMVALIGNYIIKEVNGEFYPCKPDIFEKTYEKVD